MMDRRFKKNWELIIAYLNNGPNKYKSFNYNYWQNIYFCSCFSAARTASSDSNRLYRMNREFTTMGGVFNFLLDTHGNYLNKFAPFCNLICTIMRMKATTEPRMPLSVAS